MATRSLLSVRRHRYDRKFRLHKPYWIDPYPAIPGTEPEKRIFEALILSGIFFIYQGQIPELVKGLFVTFAVVGYKPDFILPEYKIIIDPFSPYHHSLPEAVERDERKIKLYTALGYKVYHPWADPDGLFIFDQGAYPVYKQGVQAPVSARVYGGLGVLSQIEDLQKPGQFKLTEKQARLKVNPGYELGPFLGAGATSVAAANHKRTKPKPISLSYGQRAGTRRRTS